MKDSQVSHVGTMFRPPFDLGITWCPRVPVVSLQNSHWSIFDAIDILDFLFPTELLNGVFPFHCVTLSRICFVMHQFHRAASFSVFRSARHRVVCSYSLEDVVGVTSIEGSIGTFHDVNRPLVTCISLENFFHQSGGCGNGSLLPGNNGINISPYM